MTSIFRLLTVSLQGEDFISWVEALSPEYVLQRILWIAENTLNLQLLEKVKLAFTHSISLIILYCLPLEEVLNYTLENSRLNDCSYQLVYHPNSLGMHRIGVVVLFVKHFEKHFCIVLRRSLV